MKTYDISLHLTESELKQLIKSLEFSSSTSREEKELIQEILGKVNREINL